MTYGEGLFYALALGAGLLIGHMAHAQDHFWIQANPKYTERWNHQTHCCGPSHCKTAREMGVVIRMTPTGDWEVLGGPLQKPEIVPAADTYQTEPEGGLQAWICIWPWKMPGEQVACLFMPLPAT
jgi:hypothetical protein